MQVATLMWKFLSLFPQRSVQSIKRMDNEIKIPNDWAPTSELKRQRQQSLNFDIWGSESNLFDLRRIKSDFSISTMDSSPREPLFQQNVQPQFASTRYPMPSQQSRCQTQSLNQTIYQREQDHTVPKVIRYSPSRSFRDNDQTRADWNDTTRDWQYSSRLYQNSSQIPQWHDSAIYKQNSRLLSNATHERSNMALMANAPPKTSRDWSENSNRHRSREWSDSKSIVQKPSFEWSDGGSRQHSRQWSEGSNKSRITLKGSRDWVENSNKGVILLTSVYSLEEKN